MLSIIIALSSFSAAQASHTPGLSMMYVSVINHEYRVYRRSGTRETLIYSEPFDEFEAFLGEFTIAEIWPAPDGDGFVYARFFDSRNSGTTLENIRLTQFNARTKRRATLYGEDVLPGLKTMRSPGYLTWASNKKYMFGVNGWMGRKPEPKVELCVGNLDVILKYGQTGELLESWAQFLSYRSARVKFAEVVAMLEGDAWSKKFGDIDVEWSKQKGGQFKVTLSNSKRITVSVSNGEVPVRAYCYDQRLLALTVRKLRANAHGHFTSSNPAQNSYRTVLVDLKRGAVTESLPNTYMVKCFGSRVITVN